MSLLSRILRRISVADRLSSETRNKTGVGFMDTAQIKRMLFGALIGFLIQHIASTILYPALMGYIPDVKAILGMYIYKLYPFYIQTTFDGFIGSAAWAWRASLPKAEIATE